jgi:hypothetical protein
VLGDEARALEHVLEVPLRQPLALRDHAEAVRAGGLGGARVLEDLVGRHHRVHRRWRLGEARLAAEAAVLGATTRFRVHERAEVGGVAEALGARLEGALDERLYLSVILYLAERERFLVRDEGGQAGTSGAELGLKVRAPSDGRFLALERRKAYRREAAGTVLQRSFHGYRTS